MLYGEKHVAGAIPESSFGFNELFPKLVASKAKHLGISVAEMTARLNRGDAELLSALIATPVGAAAFAAYQRDKGQGYD